MPRPEEDRGDSSTILSSPQDRSLDSLDDEALMALVAGDLGRRGTQEEGHRAFEEIVRRYERRVMAFAYSYVRDQDEAAELAQETLLALYRSAGRYRSDRVHGASFLTYVFSITRNLALTARHRSARRPAAVSSLTGDEEEGPAEPESASPGPEAAAESTELRSRCEEAVMRLPAKQREVLVLRVNQELKFREISALTGETEGTLRSRFHHAILRLERQLQGA